MHLSIFPLNKLSSLKTSCFGAVTSQAVAKTALLNTNVLVAFLGLQMFVFAPFALFRQVTAPTLAKISVLVEVGRALSPLFLYTPRDRTDKKLSSKTPVSDYV